MSEVRVKSKAFQGAALSSESHRIIGLLFILGALMIGVIARNLGTGQFRLLYWQTLALALAIGWEIFTLAMVKRALRTEREVAQAIWLINVFIESGLPTLGLLLLIESQYLNPYQALVAPVVLLYFLFIILSTLRLSPSLSILTGLLSALGYLAVTAHVTRLYARPEAGLFVFPLFFFIYAGLILAGGMVAALVAG